MDCYFYLPGVDQCIQKFLDVARQTECFFLQKRLQLSVQKPEQVIKEVKILFVRDGNLSREYLGEKKSVNRPKIEEEGAYHGTSL